MEVNYSEIMERKNVNNLFAMYIGLKITEMSKGYGVTEMEIRPEFRNPIGSIHGGCLFTAADSACGAVASSYGTAVTTLDSNFHYLRAGLEDSTSIRAIATAIKKGKRVCVVSVAVEDQNHKQLAAGIFTYALIKKESPI